MSSVPLFYYFNFKHIITVFTASKTHFLALSIDFWTRNLVYLEATNSGILLQYRNMTNTTSWTVMNLLLTVSLKKTRFTESKTCYLELLVDFWIWNLAYPEATNSGILLQHSNILKTILCTIVNLLLIVLLNKKLKFINWKIALRY